MLFKYYCMTITCLLLTLSINSICTFDSFDDHHVPVVDDNKPLPRDKVLMESIKTLTFQRHKRTTSRRTHSIHQLSCVGGTAGCKLFTPNLVECENIGYDKSTSKFNWKCHADISDRVEFKHVEVICEGYDYPEDDYILLGSCGLEFTLDYISPHDYHDNSYFKHMDDHEKEMHHKRVRASAKPKTLRPNVGFWYSSFVEQLIGRFSNHVFLIGTFFLLVLCSLLLVRCLSSDGANRSPNKKRGSSYGPLASAVLTTKKAC